MKIEKFDPDYPFTKRLGRPKGIPKAPGSGRKKGTLNKSTMMRKGIDDLFIKADDYMKFSNEEKLKIMMDAIWKEATFKNNIMASRSWYEMYSTLGAAQSLGGYKFIQAMESVKSLDTFEEMNSFAEHIMQLVLKAVITPGGAKLLFDLLKERRYFKEAILEPILNELLETEKKRNYTRQDRL